MRGSQGIGVKLSDVFLADGFAIGLYLCHNADSSNNAIGIERRQS